MPLLASHTVEGYVSRGFEAVRETFAESFVRRHELGGACCAFVRGEKVVDDFLTKGPRRCFRSR